MRDTRDYLRFLLSASAWRLFEHSYVTVFVEEVPTSLAYLLPRRHAFAIDERPQRRTRFDRFDIPPAIPDAVGDDDELRAALEELCEQSLRGAVLRAGQRCRVLRGQGSAGGGHGSDLSPGEWDTPTILEHPFDIWAG